MRYMWNKKGDQLLGEILKTDLPESMAALWYVGQMGIVVKWNGLTICFDPVLNDLYHPDKTSRRNYEIPFLPEEFRGVDYTVCSHNHRDHMNEETLIPLWEANPAMKVVVPEPERESLILAGMGEDALIGAKAGETIILKKGDRECRLCPVAAAHEEYVTDEYGNQKYLGYVLKCRDLHIYHAGDTMVTQKLIEDVCAHGSMAVACIPVNGVDFERHSRGIIGNMDCRDGAYFASRIHADMTLPMHTDMVMGNEENPLMFAQYMREMYPGRKYHIMQLGERLICM